ncbi:hypothetical protein RQP46_006804 [Phenoliferia psychrophenolica]
MIFARSLLATSRRAFSTAALEQAKTAAGQRAVADTLKDVHKVIGIGSGSTIVSVVDAFGKDPAAHADRWFIPTSAVSQALLVKAGLRLGDVDQFPNIDISFDGADDIDTDLDAIKGGGGCHLREKVVAVKSKHFVLVADWRKESKILGTGIWKNGVPIEVVPFAAKSIENDLKGLSWSKSATLRLTESGSPFVTENGNNIVDAIFAEGVMANGAKLHDFVKLMVGVVDVGLFVDLADEAFFGLEDGTVKHVTKPTE